MGLLTRLALAPLAPVAGVIWLAEQLERQAEAAYYDPEAILAELHAVQAMHASGEIGDAEREAAEAELLARLDEVAGD